MLAQLRKAIETAQALKDTEIAAACLVPASDASLADVVAAAQDQNRSIVDAALELARLNKQLTRSLQEVRKIVAPYHPYVKSV